MKHVVMVLVGAVALCATSQAWCEEAVGSTRHLTALPTLSQQAVAVALSAPLDKDEADWQWRYDEAKARGRRGTRQAFVGAGASLVALLFAKKSPEVALAGTLVAGTYGGIGAYHSIKAAATIDELREEGARKGYYRVRTTDGLSLDAVPGGMRVTLGLSF